MTQINLNNLFIIYKPNEAKKYNESQVFVRGGEQKRLT
jgi:hypothetical protein